MLAGNGILKNPLTRASVFEIINEDHMTALDAHMLSRPTYTAKCLGKRRKPFHTYGRIIRFLGSSFGWASYLWRFRDVPRNRGYICSRLSIVGLLIWLQRKYNLYVPLSLYEDTKEEMTH